MIQLRITKVQEIMKKEITVVQVARELAVTRKTVHQWLDYESRDYILGSHDRDIDLHQIGQQNE